MCGADDTPSAVSQQDWRAIGNPNRSSAGWIVRDRHIGLRPRPGCGTLSPGDSDRRPVYLADEQDPVALNTDFPCHGVPLATVVTKLEAGAGEEVFRTRQQRTAA
jgi:hypothetical protein